jgi:hypothetical protein
MIVDVTTLGPTVTDGGSVDVITIVEVGAIMGKGSDVEDVCSRTISLTVK